MEEINYKIYTKNNPYEWKGTYEELLETFGRSKASFERSNIPGYVYIKFKCKDCGKEKVAQVSSLRIYHSKSLKGIKDPISDDLLCKSCKIKRIYQRDYGIDGPQQLKEVMINNKKTFYKNHPEYSPYSDEPVYYEGILKDLIENHHYQWNRKIKFKCTRCGEITIINYGTLAYRYKMWVDAGRPTDELLCTKCARSTAVHPDMIPLQKEPIKWEGSLEDLLKQSFYDKQRILFKCEICGKIETKTFGVLKWGNKERIEKGMSVGLYCENCQSSITNTFLYGTPFYNQKDIPKEILEILNNKDQLENLYNKYKDYSVEYIAKNILNISVTVPSRYLKKYNISLYISPRSTAEQEICDLLKTSNILFETNKKNIIFPYEIDIYIPSHKIGIEFNGNYWHSEENLENRKNSNPKFYHQEKLKLCEEKGIRLIHIFEYEWRNNKDKIINYLKEIFNIEIIKIDARKCQIREVDFQEAKYFEDELVSLLTFGKPRYNKKFEYELIRFTTKSLYKVRGGFSKLFNYFVKNYKPNSIITYCDTSKFEGGIYNLVGFNFKNLSSPNYVWVKNNIYLKRYETQKHKLIKQGFNGKSEDDIMKQRKFNKVYDAGNRVFEWTSQKPST